MNFKKSPINHYNNDPCEILLNEKRYKINLLDYLSDLVDSDEKGTDKVVADSKLFHDRHKRAMHQNPSKDG